MSHGLTTPADRLFGGAMIVAPLLLIASTVAYTISGGFNGNEIGGMVQIYAFTAWFLVVIGLERILQAPYPRAAVALTVLGALGVAGGIAYGVDSMHVAEFGMSAEEIGWAGPLALNLPGILFPIAHIGFGIALLRANVQPRWSGALLVVAAVLFPASRIPSVEALAVVADGLFIVALAPLGWKIVQGRVSVSSSPTLT